MSLTLTLTGVDSQLNAELFPPIVLDENKQYSIGLLSLYTYHSIPNVDVDRNDEFIYDGDKVLKIPTGTYEVDSIADYITNALSEIDRNYVFHCSTNMNTLQIEIKANFDIDFTGNNSIGSLLGFKNIYLEKNKKHTSNASITVQSFNVISVECNVATGSFINGKLGHSIHTFYPTAEPGYKIVETPNPVVYLNLNKTIINDISVKLVDENGHNINFRGENITVRLHIKEEEK